MMGLHDSQQSLFSYTIHLEKRVRPDHPLRAVRQALGDLEWVRPAVADCYGRNGHVSVDPVILVRMMVLLFLDNVASERELMAVLPERLDYLWFLGYGLEEDIPHHSVLSKARARWGSAVFEELFVRSIYLCVQAGLVEGGKLHVDSSLIKAHAAKDSLLQSSPELISALQAIAQEQAVKLEDKAPEGANATRLSTTDPGASLAKSKKEHPAQLSYKHHRAIDDAHGVITAVKTTTGRELDSTRLQPLLQQHRQNTALAARTVVADAQYGTAENYRLCQAAGVATHIKSRFSNVAQRGLMPVSQFVYEAESDRYRCPGGHYLLYHHFKKSDQSLTYRIEDPACCARCPLRAQCTRGAEGRSVSRPALMELVQAGQKQGRSTAAQADLRRRKYLMEGSFAHAANNHGFKRARWRGLWRQRLQDWLIATVQNLCLWIKKGAPRRQSGVAALIGLALGRVGTFRAHIQFVCHRIRAGLPSQTTQDRAFP
jgi:IS5 family transposase